jgi:hypothetical protein
VNPRPQESMSVGDEPEQAGNEVYHSAFYILRSVMPWLRLALRLSLRTIRRPRLALNLMRVAWRFRATNWYRRFPFLPLPDPTYLRWRMYTAYGDYGAVPSAADVERYARWASASE